MTDAVAQKMCSVCNVDCSAMKRARDPQGRYICGDCLERARQAKAAKEGKPVVAKAGPVAAPLKVAAPAFVDGVDPIMSELVSHSKALESKPCTECGYPLQKNAVLCTHCGLESVSGRHVRTAVHKAPKEAKEPGRASAVVSASTAVVGGLVGGVIGGAIGAGIWAGVAYQTHYEVGWIAWGVGVLSGGGTVLGARGATNWLTAIYATVIALVTILVGRYFALSLILDELGFASTAASDWYFDTFGPWDILWAFLALPTAFKIGGGIESD